jgi:hypothetical protein
MQCSILDTNAYGEFPVPPPVANAFPKRTITTTKTSASAVHGQAVVSRASQLPRFQSAPPVSGVWQLQGALLITQTSDPTIAVVPQFQTSDPQAATYSGPPLLPQPVLQPQPVLSSLLTSAESLVILHD